VIQDMPASRTTALAAAFVAALALGAVSQASTQSATNNCHAWIGIPQQTCRQFDVRLKPGPVIPKPARAQADATALIRVHWHEYDGLFDFVTWHLTGAVTEAHIHLGRPGTSGRALVRLCGRGLGMRPCRNQMDGSFTFSIRTFLRLFRKHGAYIDIHTDRNPAGELRGHITPAMLGRGTR
jgi:hypothetical protein